MTLRGFIGYDVCLGQEHASRFKHAEHIAETLLPILLQLAGIQGFVPVYKKFGLGATYFINARDSYYRDYPDVFRRNPEFRVFAAYSFE